MAIEIGNFIAKKQKDGTFLYKAKEPKPLTVKKEKDKPQYPLIFTIEQELKNDGHKAIKNSIIQILKYISQ